jgi:bisphosphoglycerate-dependent phosphoglycerate mutase
MKLAELGSINSVKSISILMRHAERFEIESISNHMKAELTEKGKSDAKLFGKDIASGFDSADIFHSEIKRCFQTAESIRKGIEEQNRKCSIKGSLSWLGVDIINADSSYLDAFINKNGIDKFYRKWFCNGFTKNIINPYSEIAEQKFVKIKQQLNNSTRLTINVTHDWNLMVLLRHFLKMYEDKISIPGYLDYIIFSLEEKGISIHYGNHFLMIPENN